MSYFDAVAPGAPPRPGFWRYRGLKAAASRPCSGLRAGVGVSQRPGFRPAKPKPVREFWSRSRTVAGPRAAGARES